jgi:hypothetical protein
MAHTDVIIPVEKFIDYLTPIAGELGIDIIQLVI